MASPPSTQQPLYSIRNFNPPPHHHASSTKWVIPTVISSVILLIANSRHQPLVRCPPLLRFHRSKGNYSSIVIDGNYHSSPRDSFILFYWVFGKFHPWFYNSRLILVPILILHQSISSYVNFIPCLWWRAMLHHK